MRTLLVGNFNSEVSENASGLALLRRERGGDSC